MPPALWLIALPLIAVPVVYLLRRTGFAAIVAAGVADKCEVEIAYVIGVAQPVSITADTYGTGKIDDSEVVSLIERHFDLTPAGIIDRLKLRRPVYKQTAAYRHFGREEEGFTWELTDYAELLKSEVS